MKDKIIYFISELKDKFIELLQKVIISKLKPQIRLSCRFLLKFWKHNPAYLICTIFYFFICKSFIKHSFLLFLVYIILLIIGFSPLGENLLRILNHVRPLETKKETEYLKPLFDEVCISAKKNNKNRLPHLEICVIDNMTVNAIALGRHTVAVTKGAMNTFTEDELKAVIAHEIAHILYGNTLASLYVLIGNGTFSVIVLLIKAFLFFIDWLKSTFVEKKGLISCFLSLLQLLFELYVLMLNFGFQIILTANQRKNEFQADRFSYSIGYDTDMIETLYLLEKISLGDNSNIIQKMTASHPRITLRIKHLEELDEQM